MRSALNALIVVYAVLCIVLGIYGSVTAKEYYSLAGVAIGLLQFGCLALLPKWPRWSRIGSLVVAVLVLGRFLPKYLSEGNWLPAGVLAVASAVLIIALVLGHVLGMQSNRASTTE